jgi:hypothetical protein
MGLGRSDTRDGARGADAGTARCIEPDPAGNEEGDVIDDKRTDRERIVDRLGWSAAGGKARHGETQNWRHVEAGDARLHPTTRPCASTVSIAKRGAPGCQWKRRRSADAIDRVVDALLDPAYGTRRGNTQTTPFGILSVAWDGHVSTFSPELLGTPHPAYGSFAFGDLAHQGLDETARDLRLRRIAREIARGVVRCRRECPYFAFCRGGAPANKLAEHGRFDGTATLFCQMTQMVVIETILRALETDLSRAERSATPAMPATKPTFGAAEAPSLA